MHVDTFARLKTPEVLATEVAAGETQGGDLFDRLVAGTVEILKPEGSDIRPGTEDVRRPMLDLPAGFIVRPNERVGE